MMQIAWTEERVAALRKMWLTDGFSCSRIAKEMSCGFTRNAIIGKISRLGLSGSRGQAAAPSAPAAIPRIKIEITRASRNSRVSSGSVAPYSVPSPGGIWSADNASPIALMDLRLGMCRWPLGPHPVLFCGEPTRDADDPECAYCARHAAIAYQAPARTDRVAA